VSEKALRVDHHTHHEYLESCDETIAVAVVQASTSTLDANKDLQASLPEQVKLLNYSPQSDHE
jgi:hypothetical protein